MRRSFTLFSIVVHAIVISAALLAQVFAVGPLPIPHQPILYEAASAMPIEVQLPRPPRRGCGQRQRSRFGERGASGPADRRDRRNRT